MTSAQLLELYPQPIASRIAQSNIDVTTIPDTSSEKRFSISDGFPVAYSRPFGDGGEPLKRNELNSILNLLSQLHFYWQMGGVPLWNRDIAEGSGAFSGISGYPKGARIFHEVDGSIKEFVSTSDNNTTEPGDSTMWQEL